MDIRHRSARRPTRAPDPVGYATRRLPTILLVAGAVLGVLGLAAIEQAGLSVGALILPGLTVLGAVAVARLSARALRAWARRAQLGPQAEDRIGRHTGARA